MGNDFHIEDEILGGNGQLELPSFQKSYLHILDFLSLVNYRKIIQLLTLSISNMQDTVLATVGFTD